MHFASAFGQDTLSDIPPAVVTHPLTAFTSTIGEERWGSTPSEVPGCRRMPPAVGLSLAIQNQQLNHMLSELRHGPVKHMPSFYNKKSAAGSK